MSLKLDDIKVGMFITVLKNAPFYKEGQIVFHNGEMGYEEGRKIIDRSWIGEIFQVLAIDMPFIAVKQLTGISKNTIKCFDTRVKEFKKISEEFKNALLTGNK